VIVFYVIVVCTLLLLMHYEMWWADWRHLSGGLLFIALVTIVFLRLAADQYHEIVLEVVESTINIIEQSISTFQPDVIVGEDFGAAVVAWMLNRGLWSRGTLLLSPTQYQVALHAGVKPESIALPSDVPVVIVQGSQDQLVKMSDTETYAASGSPELVQLVWQPFTADGHALESMSASKLAEFVRTVFLMKELQEKYEAEVGKELVFVEEDERGQKIERERGPVQRRENRKNRNQHQTSSGRGVVEEAAEEIARNKGSRKGSKPNPTGQYAQTTTQVAPRASARLDDDYDEDDYDEGEVDGGSGDDGGSGTGDDDGNGNGSRNRGGARWRNRPPPPGLQQQGM
jgi:hypothetical protein